MKFVVETPLCLAGEVFRAVIATNVTASYLRFGGIVARGEKRPVAIVVGSGTAARLVALDGSARDPADFGLTRQDIE